MRILCSRGRLAIVVVLVAACPFTRVAAQGCVERWEAPRALALRDGRSAYVESPTAVHAESGVLLLGMPSLIWATRDVFDPAPGSTATDTAAYLMRLENNTGFAGFILDSHALATPVPSPVKGTMRRVVAVRGAGDVIHVVWTAPFPDSAEQGQAKFLWYSEIQSGHWTTPQLLFQADRLDWSGARPSVLVRGHDVYIFAAYSDRTAGGIAFVRRVAGRWRTTKAPVFGLPSELSAEFAAGDSLVLAYVGIGARDARVPNGSHVYVLRLAVTDSVLPAAQRAQWSGLDSVHWPHIYRRNPLTRSVQELVLFWARWPKGLGGADVVLTQRSADNGRTWSPLAVLTLPFTATWLAQTQDMNGNIHIVAGRQRAETAKPTHPYSAMLRGNTWSEGVDLPIEQVVGEPTLSTINPDSLLLVWGEGRPTDRRETWGAQAPITRYAWWSQACPGRAPRRSRSVPRLHL